MSALAAHLPIVPIALPIMVGASMLLVSSRRRPLQATLGLLSLAALGVTALLLLELAAAPAAGTAVYRLGDWPAPFGIVLVADRLAAVMLVLTSVLGITTVVFALARWHRAGPHFHPLVQFLLAGLNGAFLTGDLFNLFVFFELMLAASYGLVLHGSGRARVLAGMHYIVVNLAASLLFLIGVSLIYGVTGTLNMADLALRIPALPAEDRWLLEAGAGVLGIAFLTKAAMWPLCFWLPTAYAAAAPPLAALFAIMTKVGVYVVLRLSLLLFGTGPSAGFGSDCLLFGGMATIVFGAAGVLASRDLGRLAGSAVLVSSGTVLAAIGTGQLGVTGAALFYLLSSTLAICAFFMLIELIERDLDLGEDTLARDRLSFERDEEEPTLEGEEVGEPIPAAMAVLGLCFIGCALVLAGLPPLSGFIGKLGVLNALFRAAGTQGVPASVWALTALFVLSGLATLVALVRVGIRAFWEPTERPPPRVRVLEVAPVVVLLLACATLTVQAGPVMRYLQATDRALHAPARYAEEVLAASRAEAPEP